MTSANITTLPYDVCLMNTINIGLPWVQLVSTAAIMYCFMLSKKEKLWMVLMAHAVTGFMGEEN